MIPVRVQVRNFLTYGEADGGGPIEFDFEGSRLWSISGNNGSGKSAVFDAITYALFGRHRGGATGDGRLIRKGARQCEATFEFRADGHLYRVRRTVARPGPSGRKSRREQADARREAKERQAARFDPASGEWVPVPGTDSDAALGRWVQERLGLGYDTFVTSVLLRQGESDRFITARDAERFDILRQLLGLQAYQQLEEQARSRAREARADEAALERQLDSAPAFDPADLEAAEAALAAAEAGLRDSQRAYAQAQALLGDARTFADLAAQIEECQRRLAEVERLLSDAQRIRACYEEWQAIQAAVPTLEEALRELREAAAAEAKAEVARQAARAVDLGTLEEEAQQAAAAAVDAERAAGAADESLTACRRSKEGLQPALRDLDELAQARGQARRLTAEIAGLSRELESMPAVRERHERLSAIARGLPAVEGLIAARKALEEAEGAAAEAGSPEGRRQEVERLAREVSAAATHSRQAERRLRLADRQLARAEAALEQARGQLLARQQARDEAVCSRCGQPIDPEHIARELRDAEAAVAEVGRRLAEAQADHEQAQGEEEAAQQALEASQAAEQEVRDRLRRAEQRAEQAAQACSRLDEAVTAASELPDELRRVAVEAPLPEAERALADARGQASALPQATADLNRLLGLKGQAEALGKALQEQDSRIAELAARYPPQVKQEVQAEAERLCIEEPRFQAAAEEARRAWKEARESAEAARRRLEEGRLRRQQLESDAARLGQSASGGRSQAAVRLQTVHEGWRRRALGLDGSLLPELLRRRGELAGIDERRQALERADDERREQETRRRELDRSVGRIPQEHRRPVGEAERALEERAADMQARQSERDEAFRRLQGLEHARELRQRLEGDLREAHRLRVRFGRLAELLGRGGLQARLVDDALAGITLLANETLARISGGQLRLQLSRQADARGNEEIVIRARDLASADEPLDTQFLSGSQRFRTSVAIAAAIGQYVAGSQGSAIRSLIIDEGFGSLDVQGRQEMIEELRNLSQLMDRIIVVSHQEDFQDRTLFPTGFILRKEGQRSIVERFV
jgi:DNA repair exonuclease SbcCD ATPase subunit